MNMERVLLLGASLLIPVALSADHHVATAEAATKEKAPIEIVDLGDPQPVLVIQRTSSPQGLGKQLDEILPRIHAYISAQGMEPAGPPFLRYLDMTDHFVFDAGLPVSKPMAGEGDIESRMLPGGKVITTLFTGHPAMVGTAWTKVSDFATSNGLARSEGWIGKGGWDVYLNDPDEVGLKHAQTRLYLPVYEQSAKNEERTMSDQTAEITATLVDHGNAMIAKDVDLIMSFYSSQYGDSTGGNRETRRSYFNNLIAAGVYDDFKVETGDVQIKMDGNEATAGPVTYVTGAGTARYQYRLLRESDDVWRLLSSKQSVERVLPFENEEVWRRSLAVSGDRTYLADAGILIERHAMVWERRLNVPVEKVWEMLTTLEGLKQWWIYGPQTQFDFKLGVELWPGKVLDFKEHEYIDIGDNTNDYVGTGGLRVELRRIDANTTLFVFLDTWGGDVGSQSDYTDPDPGVPLENHSPGGKGTPWPGVAAGWHGMIDNLQKLVDGTEPSHTYQEWTIFYVDYLRDMTRWNAMVQRRDT
jgi:uncharacterized protein YndB with AHSA1/START domain/effector-binding domain-containing protein/ketosteroid isomerase-like protein|tara:strand:+ start:820 stop:2406 length:1587 start_codon:yes stop_codon:yes gene_type:complete